MSRSFIEFPGDGVAITLSNFRHAFPFSEVLPNQPIGVLVQPALAKGMFEEELFQPNVDYFSGLVTRPGGQLWYAGHKRFLHPEARLHLERGIARLIEAQGEQHE